MSVAELNPNGFSMPNHIKTMAREYLSSVTPHLSIQAIIMSSIWPKLIFLNFILDCQCDGPVGKQYKQHAKPYQKQTGEKPHPFFLAVFPVPYLICIDAKIHKQQYDNQRHHEYDVIDNKQPEYFP